mgnify:CR=1 FL=1
MAVSLQKGQKISLSKEAGGELTQVKLGLGWDVAQGPQDKKGGFLGKLFGGGSGGDSIDLDASCIMFDANKQAVDAIWFSQLKSKDGSIVHTGDNRTGDGDGDDEDGDGDGEDEGEGKGEGEGDGEPKDGPGKGGIQRGPGHDPKARGKLMDELETGKHERIKPKD